MNLHHSTEFPAPPAQTQASLSSVLGLCITVLTLLRLLDPSLCVPATQPSIHHLWRWYMQLIPGEYILLLTACPHGVENLNSLCGSHFHPLAGVWSGDSRQDSSCYTDVRRKKTQYTVTLTIYCSFTAHYYYMIGFIWTVRWICPKKKKDGLWNYKSISPWTFIALLQSFDERLWQSDRSGSAVSIWLITSSVSQYLHPNL